MRTAASLLAAGPGRRQTPARLRGLPGPRGPLHSVADGSVILAQRLNLDIYALNYEASSFWKFRSWDEMVLPKPFSRINYSLSTPLNLTGLDLDADKEAIRQLLFASAEQDAKF